MIGTADQTVIVRIPVERVRAFGESGRHVYQLAQGFAFAEFKDGNAFPISNPLEEYIMSVLNSAGDLGQKILFEFVSPGERSNDGQDEKTTSVTNLETPH